MYCMNGPVLGSPVREVSHHTCAVEILFNWSAEVTAGNDTRTEDRLGGGRLACRFFLIKKQISELLSCSAVFLPRNGTSGMLALNRHRRKQIDSRRRQGVKGSGIETSVTFHMSKFA